MLMVPSVTHNGGAHFWTMQVSVYTLTYWRRNYFLILANPVYKM